MYCIYLLDKLQLLQRRCRVIHQRSRKEGFRKLVVPMSSLDRMNELVGDHAFSFHVTDGACSIIIIGAFSDAEKKTKKNSAKPTNDAHHVMV